MLFNNLFEQLDSFDSASSEEKPEIKKTEEKVENTPSVFDSFIKAANNYFNDYLAASELAERVSYGEALFDDILVKNVFHSLPLTYKNYLKERDRICSDGMPILLNKIGVIPKNEESVIEGNRLKGDGLKNHDIPSLEKGLWYLCCQS